MNRYHESGCRCVCCDKPASRVWVAAVAILLAMLFMAASGWLHDW